MRFWTCPYCGANLDPGERCDCKPRNAAKGATNTQAAGGKQLQQSKCTAYYCIKTGGKKQ